MRIIAFLALLGLIGSTMANYSGNDEIAAATTVFAPNDIPKGVLYLNLNPLEVLSPKQDDNAADESMELMSAMCTELNQQKVRGG